jgi:hypothetical protein
LVSAYTASITYGGHGSIANRSHDRRNGPGGVFVVIAVLLVLRHHRRAAEAAVAVGFGSAALFVYAHLLPTFLPAFQDSFVTGPRINVTWFSWLTAVAEIGTALMFGFAGLRTLRGGSEASMDESMEIHSPLT